MEFKKVLMYLSKTIFNKSMYKFFKKYWHKCVKLTKYKTSKILCYWNKTFILFTYVLWV